MPQKITPQKLIKNKQKREIWTISDMYKIDKFYHIAVIDKSRNIITTYVIDSEKPYQYAHKKNMNNTEYPTVYHKEITRDELKQEILECASKTRFNDSRSVKEAVKFLDKVCI